MAAVDVAADTTAERLLEAAERLIADRGLDATSVRAICAEAGANVAAVHYHYGSKDALVDAVLERRMADLTERRLAMLAPVAAERRPSPRVVVDALVRPLADFARDPDGPGRARTSASWRPCTPPTSATASPSRSRRSTTSSRPVLARSLPDVAPALVAFRLDLMTTPLFDTLADPDRALRHWHGTTPPSYDVLVDVLVDAVTGALTGGPA